MNVLKGINLSVKILFVLSLIFILLYKFVFLKVSELFYGGSIIGEIFYELALATVASSVFYFVVVHLKDYHDKKVVYKIVANKLIGLTNIRNRIQQELSNKSGVSLDNVSISEDLVKKLERRQGD